MKTLYVTSWPYGSGLSVASAWPTVRILAGQGGVSEVVYVTRDDVAVPPSRLELDLGPKVRHVPIPSPRSPLPGIGRILHHRAYLRTVRSLQRELSFDLLVCRGVSALPYAIDVHQRADVPLVVESFEPHAQYMAAAGHWNRAGARFRLQQRWERQGLERAYKIFTVSEGYAAHLRDRLNLTADRISALPCTADPWKFRPDPAARDEVRRRLGVRSRLCIYAGKFGGLYLTAREAAVALQQLARGFGESLEFLILSPEEPKSLRSSLLAGGLAPERLVVRQAEPDEVPAYLCAADFGISFHRSSPWSFAFSPIKHAEYWAAGLPVICPTGVGDESAWLPKSGIGAVADMSSPRSLEAAAAKIAVIVEDAGYRAAIRKRWLARTDFERPARLYAEIVNCVGSRRYQLYG